MYSNPPIYGASIIGTILEDPALVKLWHEELQVMSGRIKSMRTGLEGALNALGSTHDWSHITK
eukprot:CAMPEP_0201281212 /NCGR_PEP_ID=MMETSP1317-20130820/1946_1 /ASSEMBLY_ACC=CAM_ASM_000770 /TAXON_ID=187299 /ORGANISM="Undescribed Undescribed, Strain Undescribed" /LENGTH=62 /DNA_ID=CAMNT_0047590503 /DNA_START=882 /DNA_END=1070 /DNA_ORIENTATION=+